MCSSDLLLLALRQYLHASVGKISYESLEPKFPGPTLSEVAEHNKLDSATYYCMKLSHREIVA